MFSLLIVPTSPNLFPGQLIVYLTSKSDDGEDCEGNEGSIEVGIVYHYFDLKYLPLWIIRIFWNNHVILTFLKKLKITLDIFS